MDFFIVKGLSENYIQDEEVSMGYEQTQIILPFSARLATQLYRLTNRRTDWERFRLDLRKSIDLSIILGIAKQLDVEVELLVTKTIIDFRKKKTPEKEIILDQICST